MLDVETINGPRFVTVGRAAKLTHDGCLFEARCLLFQTCCFNVLNTILAFAIPCMTLLLTVALGKKRAAEVALLSSQISECVVSTDHCLRIFSTTARLEQDLFFLCANGLVKPLGRGFETVNNM